MFTVLDFSGSPASGPGVKKVTDDFNNLSFEERAAVAGIRAEGPEKTMKTGKYVYIFCLTSSILLHFWCVQK